jgi:hypothetical protein
VHVLVCLSLSPILLSSSLLSPTGDPSEFVFSVFLLGLSSVLLASFLFPTWPLVSLIWSFPHVFSLNPRLQHSTYLPSNPTSRSLHLLLGSSRSMWSFHRDMLLPLLPMQFFLSILFPVSSYLIKLLEGWLVSTSQPNLIYLVYTHPLSMLPLDHFFHVEFSCECIFWDHLEDFLKSLIQFFYALFFPLTFNLYFFEDCL